MYKSIKKSIDFSAILLILLLTSCVSNKVVFGPPISVYELEKIEIIGSVETTFETTINRGNNNLLLERSYHELLKAANKNYTGKIDIKNIIIEKRGSKKNLIFIIPVFFGDSIGMSYTNVYVKGKVIRYNNE